VIRRLLAISVACALVPVLTDCSGGSAKPAASPTPASVSTVTASDGSITPTLQIAGVIVPYRQAGVSADLTEPITEVDVQEGDHVHAGEVLARLLTDDLEAQLASAERIVSEDRARYNQTAYQVYATNALDQSAIKSDQAALHQDQVNLDGAEVDLKRYASLASQGYLPQQTVDEQRTTVASDASAVTAARATLSQAIANAQANGVGSNAGEQLQELAADREAANSAEASVVQLQREIARAVIVAPADGIVDAVNANPREYTTSRELFTIEENASVYAVLPASTTQVMQIRDGAAAALTVPGSTRRDQGHVVAVLDQIQPGTTNFTVKVLVPNPDGHLHAGMPVSGIVDLPSVSGVEIPMTAFVDDTHTSVFTVDNGTVKTQKVAYVNDDVKNAIVTGLPAGSTVVKDVEASTVAAGDRVAVNSK
jgi:multidrug efflux pump subunit AcrA (membrane-fusion protein)